MFKVSQLVLASVFVAVISFGSATTALADTANFNFEGVDLTSDGELPSLTSTVGSLTMTLTRIGSPSTFGIFNIFEAPFGSRSLRPFDFGGTNTGGTSFNANFSSAISSISIDMGDYSNSDLDTLSMFAYDDLDGAGNLVGMATTTCCGAGDGSFVFSTLTVSGVGIRSVRFIGGSADFPNSVFYDNITATFTPAPIPEPATLMLLGTGLIGVAAKFRRRRNSRGR